MCQLKFDVPNAVNIKTVIKVFLFGIIAFNGFTEYDKYFGKIMAIEFLIIKSLK